MCSKAIPLCLALLIFLFFPLSAMAEEVYGCINTDKHWSSPMHVTQNVYITCGATVTIGNGRSDGPVIKFDKGTSLIVGECDVAQCDCGCPNPSTGKLLVQGGNDVERHYVKFTSAAGNPKPGDWGAVILTPGSEGSDIDYAKFLYGGGRSWGTNYDGLGAALIVMSDADGKDDKMAFSEVHIGNSGESGLLCYGAECDLTLKDAKMNGNKGFGISVDMGGKLFLKAGKKAVMHNGGGGISIKGHGSSVTIRRPWIYNTEISRNGGHGITLSQGTLDMDYVNIQYNNATGIWVQSGCLKLRHGNISGNKGTFKHHMKTWHAGIVIYNHAPDCLPLAADSCIYDNRGTTATGPGVEIVNFTPSTVDATGTYWGREEILKSQQNYLYGNVDARNPKGSCEVK